MYITLQEWLNLFKSPKINFQNFKKSVKVRKNNGDILKVSSYKTLPISFYKKIYSIMVLDKEKYLINFYNKSLKILENNYPICLKNNKSIQYKNIIRNLYYKEILQETKQKRTKNQPKKHKQYKHRQKNTSKKHTKYIYIYIYIYI